MKLKLEQIGIDGGTQPRASLDQDTVANYAEHLTAGGKLPKARVFTDGSNFWLSRGFHRYFAHKQAGLEEMEVEIAKGTLRDAILDAVADNHDHGLPRSRADKERSVLLLLKDQEWSNRSTAWIAEQCHVSDGFVEKVRATSHMGGSNNGATTRTGRDGKQRSPQKTGPILCLRCSRVGAIQGCLKCLEAQKKARAKAKGTTTAAAPKKPRQGVPRPGWRTLEEPVRAMTRLLDTFGKAYGCHNGVEHSRCLAKLEAFRDQLRKWFEEAVKG